MTDGNEEPGGAPRETPGRGPPQAGTMRLIVLTPTAQIFDAPVRRIIAPAVDGQFGMLPRHIDFTAPLAVGILTLVDEEGRERFAAIDRGVLLKVEGLVRIAARRAVVGPDLGQLRRTVEEEFLAIDEHEREVRNAAARLEAGMVRRFVQIEEAR